ncbi:MAG: hypothetical protein AAF384_10135 [Pseudomonadota bacterium]
MDDSSLNKISSTLRDQSLDEITRARLRAARVNALEQYRDREPYFARWWVPGGIAIAFSLLLAIGQQFDQIVAPDALLTEVDAVFYEQDAELIDDLDFYQWLEARHAPSG